jgi:hypothetical protein
MVEVVDTNRSNRDLLQRHYTVHGRDANQQEIPAVNGMIPKSAGRTPIACSNCAKTKTKCDKKFPCSRCAGRNLKCTLRPTRRSSKNATRMGLVVPPEGLTAMPPHNVTITNGENGQTQPQLPNGSPTQTQPALKPASPKSALSSIPEDKHTAPTMDAPQTHFIDPTNGPTPPDQTIMTPPLPQGPNGFIQTTPMSAFDEFNQLSAEDSDPGSSPRFMLDWSQMQMPLGFDTGVVNPDMLMNADLQFDPSVMQMIQGPDGMMPMMADMQANLITPIETPKVERAFSDLELSNTNPMVEPQRQMSTSSSPDQRNDMAAVVAAQDGWSVFRCTPTVPSSSCPKTARLNLERLEQSLRNHEGWSTWTPRWDEADFAGSDHLTVMQLHESTRDKLLAITQSFLHKALDIHRDNSSHYSPSTGRMTPGSNSGSNFVILPPARVLEYFLRSYANCFERYYPLTSRGILDANELMLQRPCSELARLDDDRSGRCKHP